MSKSVLFFELQIEELEQLTLDEFKQWSVRLLMPGPYRKKLSIQVRCRTFDFNFVICLVNYPNVCF